MKRFTLLVCAALVIVTGAPADAAQYYKWTDEKGVVHYGTTPPKDVQSETKSVRTAASTPAAAAPAPAATDAAPDAEAGAGKTAAAENARRMAEYERQRCDYARRQLSEAQQRRAPRVREMRGSERRTQLIGEQKAEQSRHQADISSFCKG